MLVPGPPTADGAQSWVASGTPAAGVSVAVSVAPSISGDGSAVALALAGIASYATYFDFGIAATPYHAVVAFLAGLTVVWLLFGEWALSGSGSRASGLFHSRPVEVYGYMVGLWWLTLAILWTGIADFAQIREVG